MTTLGNHAAKPLCHWALAGWLATCCACAGTTVLPDRDPEPWLELGEEGDFTRPANRAENVAWARQERRERRQARLDEAHRAADGAADKPKTTAAAASPPSLATRPAGPVSSRHKTPQQRAEPRSKDPRAASLQGVKHKWDRAARRVQAARRLLGRTDLGRKPLVAVVLKAAGQRVEVRKRPYAAALHRLLSKQGRAVRVDTAAPGDIVLFRKTHDLNGNGRPDDGITWAGIVEQVIDGRIVFIAHRAGKVRRMAATPGSKTTVRDGDVVLNTRLVRWPGARRSLTAGECVAAIVRP